MLEEWSESQRVLANPDGSMTLEDHMRPRWVKRSDGWVPVDTSLVRKESGALAPKATSTDLSFSGGGDSALVTIANGGDKPSLAWPWKLPTPIVDGDTATYPEAIPGSSRSTAEEPDESTPQAPMDVSLSGQDLVVAPDQTMMGSPDTQFPIVLDPDWTTSKLGSKGTAVSRNGTILGGHHRWDELLARVNDRRIDPDAQIRINVYGGEQ